MKGINGLRMGQMGRSMGDMGRGVRVGGNGYAWDLVNWGGEVERRDIIGLVRGLIIQRWVVAGIGLDIMGDGSRRYGRWKMEDRTLVLTIALEETGRRMRRRKGGGEGGRDRGGGGNEEEEEEDETTTTTTTTAIMTTTRTVAEMTIEFQKNKQ